MAMGVRKVAASCITDIPEKAMGIFLGSVSSVVMPLQALVAICHPPAKNMLAANHQKFLASANSSMEKPAERRSEIR